jgi:hypothetical protein
MAVLNDFPSTCDEACVKTPMESLLPTPSTATSTVFVPSVGISELLTAEILASLGDFLDGVMLGILSRFLHTDKVKTLEGKHQKSKITASWPVCKKKMIKNTKPLL